MKIAIKNKEQRFHTTSVLYLLLVSPNALSLADVPPKQLISFPDILRQTFQSLVPQFLRHPVKGFGNAAGDTGKAVGFDRGSCAKKPGSLRAVRLCVIQKVLFCAGQGVR